MNTRNEPDSPDWNKTPSQGWLVSRSPERMTRPWSRPFRNLLIWRSQDLCFDLMKFSTSGLRKSFLVPFDVRISTFHRFPFPIPTSRTFLSFLESRQPLPRAPSSFGRTFHTLATLVDCSTFRCCSEPGFAVLGFKNVYISCHSYPKTTRHRPPPLEVSVSPMVGLLS